jgi:hypothetical protein
MMGYYIFIPVYLFTCFNWRTIGQILRKYEHYAIADHPKLLPFSFLQLRIIAWMIHKFVKLERYYYYAYFWNHIHIATTSTSITKISLNIVDVIVKATQQTVLSRSINSILDLFWGKAHFRFHPEQQISWIRFFCGFTLALQANARLVPWVGHNCFFPNHQSSCSLVV